MMNTEDHWERTLPESLGGEEAHVILQLQGVEPIFIPDDEYEERSGKWEGRANRSILPEVATPARQTRDTTPEDRAFLSNLRVRW